MRDYRAFFDSTSPRDYAIADFLKTQLKSHDQIFLWGNNGQLYVLTNTLPLGKYIVEYHMSTSQQTITETQQTFLTTQPKFVILMPNVQQFPFSLSHYVLKLTINNAAIYERKF